MQKRLKEKDRRSGLAHSVATEKKKHFPLPMLVGVLLSLFAIFAMLKKRTDNHDTAIAGDLPTIEDLVRMSDEQIENIGIVRTNLACAQGLGQVSETAKLLKLCDQMAAAVWATTVKNQHRFVENPAEYEHSEIYYKVGMLVTVLGQDFGVRYNSEKIQSATDLRPEDDRFYDNPADVFLSGLLGEARMGTCSSMPVLCVAVGRKLGYPLKLTSAKGHLFFRWDDGRQHMNFENTNKFSSHDDAYYKAWPYPITDAELKQGLYLQSLTPRQELAVFLSIRGCVLDFQGRNKEAFQSVLQASQLHSHPDYQAAMRGIQRREIFTTRPKLSAAEERSQREMLLQLQEVFELSRPPRYVSDLPPEINPPHSTYRPPAPIRSSFPQPQSTRFKR